MWAVNQQYWPEKSISDSSPWVVFIVATVSIAKAVFTGAFSLFSTSLQPSAELAASFLPIPSAHRTECRPVSSPGDPAGPCLFLPTKGRAPPETQPDRQWCSSYHLAPRRLILSSSHLPLPMDMTAPQILLAGPYLLLSLPPRHSSADLLDISV